MSRAFLCFSCYRKCTQKRMRHIEPQVDCSSYAVFSGQVGIYMRNIKAPNITAVSGLKYNNNF